MSRYGWVMFRASALAGLLLAGAVLSGCTPTPVPPLEPLPPTFEAVEPPGVGTVVASGTFESPTGEVSGSLTIRVAETHFYELELHDFTGPEGIVDAQLVPERMTSARTCYDTGFRTSAQLAGPGSQALPLGDIGNIGPSGGNNPTFLDAVVIVVHTDPRDAATCYLPVAGFANLEWDFPDMRPDIAVEDHGPRVGAEGEVTEANGRPLAYLVAPDDILGEIAERFGLTIDDLLYLNPTRVSGADDSIAYADEVLNLDKANR
ncbi:MAG: hypothetical protein JWP85_1009 [Rhodoglobus sp.]|nr:hypothetical protein [Rhodoglobus sp.]